MSRFKIFTLSGVIFIIKFWNTAYTTPRSIEEYNALWSCRKSPFDQFNREKRDRYHASRVVRLPWRKAVHSFVLRLHDFWSRLSIALPIGLQVGLTRRGQFHLCEYARLEYQVSKSSAPSMVAKMLFYVAWMIFRISILLYEPDLKCIPTLLFFNLILLWHDRCLMSVELHALFSASSCTGSLLNHRIGLSFLTDPNTPLQLLQGMCDIHISKAKFFYGGWNFCVPQTCVCLKDVAFNCSAFRPDHCWISTMSRLITGQQKLIVLMQ